ncbi:MAG: hypothetical protein WCC42_21960, partial [Pseudolabrys sp.]
RKIQMESVGQKSTSLNGFAQASRGTMPRDGATTFNRQARSVARGLRQVGRDGCYGLYRIIEKRGRDAKPIDWLDELTTECPKKIAHT